MPLPVLVVVAAMAMHSSANLPEAPTQYVLHGSDPALPHAAQLLNSNQPSQALDLLQAAMQIHPLDADILLLAGLAAYRSDQLKEALDYWTQSLELTPNTALTHLYEDAARELAADRSGDKIYGPHIALRYEGDELPIDSALSLMATLEKSYSRVSEQLGCNMSERIVAIVQSREQYVLASGTAEWTGGYYDGRIHVAFASEPEIERALVHELVHACLASIPSGSSPWPVWLQEGLAQKLSGDELSLSARADLWKLAQQHALPRLESLDRDWFRLSRHNATVAYNLSLQAINELYDAYRIPGIREILSHTEVLQNISLKLDFDLGL